MTETPEQVTQPGLPIRCAYTELVAPETLKPHPKNPNQHPQKQIELFAKIMRFNGVRRPIVVSKRSGFITKGHGQLQASLLMQLKLVPVDHQDYDSEEQEIADIIADNQLAAWSQLDRGQTFDLIKGMEGAQLDLEVTGFSSDQLEHLMAEMQAQRATIETPIVTDAPAEEPKTDEAYQDQAIKKLQLFFSAEDYPKVVSTLELLMLRFDLDDYSSVVLRLLNEQNPAPAQTS